MKEMLRLNLATQTSVYREIRYNTQTLIQMMKDGKTVNVDGYEMSLPLYEHSAGIDLLSLKNPSPLSALLVQIGKRDGNITKPFKSLQRCLRNCEVALSLEEPFWKEIKPYYARAEDLFRLTIQWLEK